MRAARTSVTVAVLALALAACSTDSLTERLTEEVAEQAAGGDANVDFDAENGGITVESSEGRMQIGSGSIPASFPDDLPLPEGEYSVASSFEQQNADEDLELQVAVMTPTAFADVASYYESALAEAGWEITDQTRTQLGEIESVTLTVEKDGVGALINIGAMEEGETLVNYGIGTAN